MTDTSDPLQCVAQSHLMGEWIPRVVSGCEVRQTPTPSFSFSVGRQVGGGVFGGDRVPLFRWSAAADRSRSRGGWNDLWRIARCGSVK